MSKHSISTHSRLSSEAITYERQRAIRAAESLAAICCSQKRTDIGDYTTFFLNYDPAYNRVHKAGPGYGCPRIVVGPDDDIQYFASSMNVNSLPLLLKNLRMHRADLRVYDEYAAALQDENDSLAAAYKDYE